MELEWEDSGRKCRGKVDRCSAELPGGIGKVALRLIQRSDGRSYCTLWYKVRRRGIFPGMSGLDILPDEIDTMDKAKDAVSSTLEQMFIARRNDAVTRLYTIYTAMDACGMEQAGGHRQLADMFIGRVDGMPEDQLMENQFMDPFNRQGHEGNGG